MAARYALYFAPPPSSPLWRLGSRLLGRDAQGSEACAALSLPPRLDTLWQKASPTPARYGFHATLKPPMRLRTGQTPELLLEAVERFCAGEPSFALPRLELASLHGFLALVPKTASADLDGIAGRVVAYFEPFRAPLNDQERARRKPERLNPRMARKLESWGYPYVFSDFAFHMTLTARLSPAEMALLEPVYRRILAPVLDMPLAFDHLAVFRQSAPDQPFLVWQRFALAGR